MDRKKLLEQMAKTDYSKMSEDSAVLGKDNDMTSSEFENKVAEDGLENTMDDIGTVEEDTTGKRFSSAQIGKIGESFRKLGSAGAKVKTDPRNYQYSAQQPQDLMSAKRKALMQLLGK